jgi:uncharacterized protein
VVTKSQMIKIQQIWLHIQQRTRQVVGTHSDISRSNWLDSLILGKSQQLQMCTIPIDRRERYHATKPVLSLLLVTGWIALAGISPAIAQERKPSRTITASGKGLVTIPTTLSQIRLAIEVQAKTPIGAQQDAARRSTKVVEYLKTQRVDKLQTTGISLNPTYTYPPNGRPQITGYTATNSISFRVTTDRAGAILDAAVKTGATRIDGVSFAAADSAIASAQLQALKQATQDAQRQADAVLETLNLKRKEVIGIQIANTSTPTPIPMLNQAAFAKTASDVQPPTPVVGGEQQVEASVTLDIGY